ncbi:Hypothetical_protein [Hexamita inflata]|uniref:Hypothetical_protein n=1 Tax=Hexamita inflata TaxID=28002 RepID=A0AA86PS24_9EUKA|nr:Hypothetical protein HINF_LOCUS32331 [Hexamita inflata]
MKTLPISQSKSQKSVRSNHVVTYMRDYNLLKPSDNTISKICQNCSDDLQATSNQNKPVNNNQPNFQTLKTNSPSFRLQHLNNNPVQQQIKNNNADNQFQDNQQTYSQMEQNNQSPQFLQRIKDYEILVNKLNEENNQQTSIIMHLKQELKLEQQRTRQVLISQNYETNQNEIQNNQQDQIHYQNKANNYQNNFQINQQENQNQENYNQELESLYAEIAQRDQYIAFLQLQSDGPQVEMNNIQQQIEITNKTEQIEKQNLKKQISELIQQNYNNEAVIRELKSTNNTNKQNEIDKLNHTIKNIQEQLEAEIQFKQTFQNQTNLYQAENQTLLTQVTELKMQNVIYNQTISQLNEQLATQAKQVLTFKNNLDEAQQDNTQISSQIIDYQTQIHQNNIYTNELKTEIQILKQQLEQYDTSNLEEYSVKQQVLLITNERNTLRTQLQTLQADLQMQNQNPSIISEQSQKIIELEALIISLRKQLANRKDIVTELEAINSDLRQTNNECIIRSADVMQEQIQLLLIEKMTLEQKLSQLNYDYSVLLLKQNEPNQLAVTIQELENQLIEKFNIEKQLRSDLEQCKQQSDLEIQSLQNALNESEKHSRDLENSFTHKINILTAQLNMKLQDDSDYMINEKLQIKEEMKYERYQLEEKLNQVKAELQKQQSEAQKLKEVNTEIEVQVPIMKNTIAQLQKQLKEKSMQSNQMEVTQLETSIQLKQQQKEITELQNTCQSQQRELLQAQESLNREKTQIQIITEQNQNNLNQIITQKQEALVQLETLQIKQQQQQIEFKQFKNDQQVQSSNELAQLQSKLDKCEHELADLTSVYNCQLDIVNEQSSRIKQQASQLDELKSELRKYKQELIAANTSCAQKDSILKDNADQISAQSQLISNLEQELAECTLNLQKLQNISSEHQAQLSTEKQHQQSLLQSQATEYEQLKLNLSQQLETSQSQITELQNKLSTLKDQENLYSQLNALKEINQKEFAINNSVQEENKKLQLKLQKSETKLENALKLLSAKNVEKETMNRINQLIDEVQDLKIKNE